MLPISDNDFAVDFEFESQHSKTFKIDWENAKIEGFIDAVDAIKQTVALTLMTDRFVYPIYSHNYGFEKKRIIGKPIDIVKLEMEDAIRDALLIDDRIKSVENFTITIEKDAISASFLVKSIFGDDVESEVNIRV